MGGFEASSIFCQTAARVNDGKLVGHNTQMRGLGNELTLHMLVKPDT